MKSKFPKKVFISVEDEGSENEFLTVNNNMDTIGVVGEEIKVGVYTLEKIVTVVTEVKVKK